MFRTDEMIARQKIEDMRAAVEYERMRKQFNKEKRKVKRSIWIVVLSILHLRKEN